MVKIELNTSDIKPIQREHRSNNAADPIRTALIDMRMAAQMTQAEVAAAIGLERTSVTNIESGKQRPELRHLTKLAEHFELEVHISLRPKQDAAIAARAAAKGDV